MVKITYSFIADLKKDMQGFGFPLIGNHNVVHHYGPRRLQTDLKNIFIITAQMDIKHKVPTVYVESCYSTVF